MPHKRTRRNGVQPGESGPGDDSEPAAQNKRRRQSDGPPRKRREEGVSRSFARTMARANGFRPPSGLDEGEGPKKSKSKSKAKLTQPTSGDTQATGKATQPEVPAILPGERLADYSARVDAALPLHGTLRRGKGPAIPGIKQSRTKTERKMNRMQDEWRKEDAKIKAKQQETAEDLEDELDERLPGVSVRHLAAGKDAFDDPWAAVGKKRPPHEKSAGLVGLHDVVKAPPRLKPQKNILRDPGVN